jgi:hypothetical protein
MPHSRAADLNFELSQAALAKLVDRQVGLLFNPTSQFWLVFAQSRAPVTTDLLGPAVTALLILPPQPCFAAAAHSKSLVHFAWAFSALSRRDDPFAQIFTQGSHDFLHTLFPTVCLYK